MLPDWYNKYKNKIDEAIIQYYCNYFNEVRINELTEIKEATLYAVNGWKRIRSILAIEFYLNLTNKTIDDLKINDDILLFCVALESIHAYSLVHDDLPCIDNDILRRGEKTVWYKYSEDLAVLVWDLLNTNCYEILADIWNITLMKEISKAVWIKWMIWWQVLDIYFEKNNSTLNIEKLKNIHNMKTWALIQVSILWWLILWNLDLKPDNKYKKADLKKYIHFWEKIGLAFQIKDDLLDVEWTVEETGKSVWWEDKWFVYFLWIDKSKKDLNDLLEECSKIIKNLKSQKLDFLVEYIGSRKK